MRWIPVRRAVSSRRCSPEVVEQGDDGPAQDVGDALVDVGVEGGGVGRGRVFHRLCARQVLHVEEVHTHLTCDVAVPEQHGDVEDGASGEECEGAGAGLDSTEVLEGPQFFAGQQPVAAGFQFGSVVLDE
ncbi:hypothetical protein ACH5A2_16405 [Streptomyces collinus]|uniref:hypothetical protein n=1 Tax=Streptomyces collinus TaxID=42684 RepID=UPI0037B8FCD5